MLHHFLRLGHVFYMIPLYDAKFVIKTTEIKPHTQNKIDEPDPIELHYCLLIQEGKIGFHTSLHI